MLSLETGFLLEATDVIFDETIFPHVPERFYSSGDPNHPKRMPSTLTGPQKMLSRDWGNRLIGVDAAGQILPDDPLCSTHIDMLDIMESGGEGKSTVPLSSSSAGSPQEGDKPAEAPAAIQVADSAEHARDGNMPEIAPMSVHMNDRIEQAQDGQEPEEAPDRDLSAVNANMHNISPVANLDNGSTARAQDGQVPEEAPDRDESVVNVVNMHDEKEALDKPISTLSPEFVELAGKGEPGDAKVGVGAAIPKPRRGTRVRKPKVQYANEAVINDHIIDVGLGPCDAKCGSCDKCTFDHQVIQGFCFATTDAISKDKPPQSLKQALTREGLEKECWWEAVMAELMAHDENGTWEWVECPENAVPISCRWVFQKKLKDIKTGGGVRYKARLVAKGCGQIYGVNFTETYAPTGAWDSLRMVLTIAVHFGLFIELTDAIAAFLQSELSDVLFMEAPEGTIYHGVYVNGKKVVCRLRKGLYGLKQASREWYKTLRKGLESMGFKAMDADPSVFLRFAKDGSLECLIFVWVDDLLVAVVNMSMMDDVMAELQKRFAMQRLGFPSQMLGCRMEKLPTGAMTLDQEEYIEETLEKWGMSNCGGVETPMDSTPLRKMQPDECRAERAFDFPKLVGALIWIASASRPDIAQAVSELARHMANPTKEHWAAARRLLRYLKATKSLRLRFEPRAPGGEESPMFMGYTDASFASCIDTNRSRSGYVFFLGNTPVSWKSQRQSTVAQSTMEAEYIGMNLCVRQLIWIRRWLGEAGLLKRGPSLLCGDNQAAIRLSLQGVRPKNSRHIKTKYSAIKEEVKEERVRLDWVDTLHMVADIFTKPLQGATFKKFRAHLLAEKEHFINKLKRKAK